MKHYREWCVCISDIRWWINEFEVAWPRQEAWTRVWLETSLTWIFFCMVIDIPWFGIHIEIEGWREREIPFSAHILKRTVWHNCRISETEVSCTLLKGTIALWCLCCNLKNILFLWLRLVYWTFRWGRCLHSSFVEHVVSPKYWEDLCGFFLFF